MTMFAFLDSRRLSSRTTSFIARLGAVLACWGALGVAPGAGSEAFSVVSSACSAVWVRSMAANRLLWVATCCLQACSITVNSCIASVILTESSVRVLRSSCERSSKQRETSSADWPFPAELGFHSTLPITRRAAMRAKTQPVHTSRGLSSTGKSRPKVRVDPLQPGGDENKPNFTRHSTIPIPMISISEDRSRQYISEEPNFIKTI